MRLVPWQPWRARGLAEPATSSRWTLSQSSITLRLLNNSGLVRHLLSFRCTGKRIHTDRLELDDVLRLLPNATLSALDSALKRFINLCSTYHGAPSIYGIANELLTLMFDRYAEQYLQSPLQLEHAVGLLLDSELFEFHSERMCEIITDEARTVSAFPTHA